MTVLEGGGEIYQPVDLIILPEAENCSQNAPGKSEE